MIDLHNHMLPGLDDGSIDLEGALDLARMAVADGIKTIVCTPHMHPGRHDNSVSGIQAACARMKVALFEADIALRIAAAAEVRFGDHLPAAIESQSLPFMGEWEGRRVVLLEFPHGQIPYAAEHLIDWLLAHGIVAMIAHPERNKAVMRNPAKLRPFVARGCLLQVTGASLTGYFGQQVQSVARDLLEQGVVHVLASDGHNVRHRPAVLAQAHQCAAQLIGDRKAYALVHDTPWEIAQGLFA
ncbi:capsular biosynthesis protein [Pseudomonas sp. PDM32]|uniref:tyrosine-protein phosphatase n=1 Tax=Pseudomonas sp. PDM32 TaxID=2854768 RepID=UPI001C4567AB|nr:CpsB/CapC family capsule biosynthesis tyrosine phosphatase [Pseudomonas sp. PDM32]MBV7576689.1 capsular biosynthesis protein [Pseudomonas sp. PDM32]